MSLIWALLAGGGAAGAFLFLARLWPRLPFAEPLSRLEARVRSRRKVFRSPGEEAKGMDAFLLEMASSLRSGQNLWQAVMGARAEAPPGMRPLLDRIEEECRKGASLVQALELLGSSRHRAWRLFAHLCQVHVRGGGNLVPSLLALASRMREEARLGEEVRAKTAEARWSARVVMLTPLFLLGYLYRSTPHLLAYFLDSPEGRWALIYALSSWSVGAFLLHRLMKP